LSDPLGVHALLLIGSTLYTTGEFNQAQSGLMLSTRLRGAAFNITDSQIQAWNPSTNRVINGLARDSDGRRGGHGESRLGRPASGRH
jgi:hypothetical protein